MRRLFAAAGVDFDQWKALTVVALKLDFRGSSISQRQTTREAKVVITLIFQAIFYTMFGGIKAVIWNDVIQFCVMFAGLAATVAFLIARLLS